MRQKYNINNLDCANCAREVEESLNKNKDLKNVIVNFNTKKISFESDVIGLKEINELVKKVEPDCTVTKEVEEKREYNFLVFISAIIIYLLSLVIKNVYLKETLIIVSYLLLVYRPMINALKVLIRNKSINENMLITISAIGAYLINQKSEGIMVVALYILGKILEEKALNKSRKEISNILSIKASKANLEVGNVVKEVELEEIKINDILVVKKGEKVPVDGVIISGNSDFDTSVLTGESEARSLGVDDQILSGMINSKKMVKMRATSTYSDSTVSRILDLVTNATDQKAKTETLVARLSKIYTPVVLILAILVILIFPVFGFSFKEAVYRGLTFLVISCPCAIAISVPLSYFSAIGAASHKGILIKGSNYLDLLSNVDKIVFDKTGTLTTGTFKVKDIEIIDKNYSKEEVIDYLCKGESFSNHPIAKSILNLNKDFDNNDVKDFEEISGLGIKFKIKDHELAIGNKNLCACEYDSSIHLNIDGKHVASIIIDDGLKDEALSTIKELNDMNIETIMFTGDRSDVAKHVASELNIKYKAELLPTDKYKELEKLKKNGIVAFVGDGINDAPVLKLADVGISMGSIGQSIAIEASDIVIMTDKLNKIVEAINLSKFTKKIIKQNLIFALLIKIVILLLNLFGITTMWFAVFADTGVTLIAILNTLRILKK